MTRSGVIGSFHWIELPTHQYDIPIVVRHLSREVTGLIAVNVSWDSGLMVPTADQQKAGWHSIGDFAVSPPVHTALASEWPASSCQGGRFDEWYFFRNVDAVLKLDAFCNWCGGDTSLEHASALAFPGGIDLLAQLEEYRPELVIGDGTHLFVISLQPQIIESVRAFDQAQNGGAIGLRR